MPPPRATQQDGSYPRPQLLRAEWFDLSGEWEFRHDDDDVGRNAGWWRGGVEFDRRIVVPYPPESPLSGIHATGFHPVVWYRRMLAPHEIAASGYHGEGRVLLHFGAVDYRAAVWANGHLVGEHEGGQTPFAVDITEHLGDEVAIVVRAEDDPRDVAQPRGKQDWLEEPHVIWYHRTTGIWQPVWLESVPELHVRSLAWSCDLPAACVDLELELSGRPGHPVRVRVALASGDTELAEVLTVTAEPRSRVRLHLPQQSNGQAYERLLWSPEQPNLLDARVTVERDGAVIDEVSSYLGLRSVGVRGARFMLNDRPVFVRSVLEQGYWPESHLAAPSAAALREEVRLIKELGFNAARIHEKAEDPRLLFWADRLGLMIWGELGSAFEFSTAAVSRTLHEWTDVVLRDRSHPSIVTWVPLNESWGVQHIAHDPAQLSFARALYHATKALDPTRPVISNDGWEHAESDLLTIHDYAGSGDALRRSYADRSSIDAMLTGLGPAGRRLGLVDAALDGLPVMVTEFGGVSFAPGADEEAWGYSTATSAEQFERLLRELIGALNDSEVLAGFCYTQLTDTRQETNGLTDEHRKPKLPAATIRSIVTGLS